MLRRTRNCRGSVDYRVLPAMGLYLRAALSRVNTVQIWFEYKAYFLITLQLYLFEKQMRSQATGCRSENTVNTSLTLVLQADVLTDPKCSPTLIQRCLMSSS